MMEKRKSVVTTITMVSLVIATTGCSLLNPYVRAKELDGGGGTAAGFPGSSLPANQALLGSITAAAAQRTAYYDAVGDRAKLRNGLPLVLIPLSAVALYKGLSSSGGESTRKLLLQEGLVGATLFGLGGYYTSTAREQTYLAGAKALSCSIYAMAPYYLPDALARRLDLAHIEAISQELALLDTMTQQVRGAQPAGAPPDPQVAALVARAESSITAGRRVLRQAVETQALLDDAGARLRATVENVASEVDAQIARSEPDPATILTIAGNLPATAKQFAPGGTFTAAAERPAQPIDIGVAEAMRPLRSLADQLVAQINKLDAIVGSVQFALDVIAQRVKTTPALETCQVQGSQGRIEISPEAVDIKVGETKQFVVRSTAGIPSVEWVGSVSPQVEMTKALAGETMVVQVTYKAAVEGLSEMTLQAATKELKKQVTVHLLPGAASPPNKDETQSGAAKAPAPKTGAPGAQQPAKKTDPGSPANNAARLGPQNAFEKDLDAEKVKALQQKLKVPRTGVFDAATRAAILKWQQANKSPLRDGVLQTATYDAIMK